MKEKKEEIYIILYFSVVVVKIKPDLSFVFPSIK